MVYYQRLNNFEYNPEIDPELIEAFEDYMLNNMPELFSNIDLTTKRIKVSWADMRSVVSPTDKLTPQGKTQYIPKTSKGTRRIIDRTKNNQNKSQPRATASRTRVIMKNFQNALNRKTNAYSETHQQQILFTITSNVNTFQQLVKELDDFNKQVSVEKYQYNKVWYGNYIERAYAT